MKYVFVRRLIDGVTLDIPETQLAETLKRGFEVVKEATEITMEETPLKIECPICGFIAKSDFGLKVHKKKHV